MISAGSSQPTVSSPFDYAGFDKPFITFIIQYDCVQLRLYLSCIYFCRICLLFFFNNKVCARHSL